MRRSLRPVKTSVGGSASCAVPPAPPARFVPSARLLVAIVLAGIVVALAPWGTRAAALPDVVEGQPLPSLAPMLERVTPAVVNISTRGPARARSPLLDDPFFRRFLDPGGDSRPSVPRSTGSGVVVDAGAGLVVTNEHVVSGAADIVVTLADGRERAATLVGADPEADIALLAIEPGDLVALPWADSDRLRVGDFCVAIGNPFGLGQTVTSGIVSALGRSGLGIEAFEDFIQTDASINPGNSGGALVNLAGELIGINTAIVGPAGGNVGIGFAVPANLARDIVEQLREFGEVRRGALGIAAQPLTPRLAEALGTDARAGVVVGRVRAGSPAERAGIRAGDVITAIDGRPVRDMGAVRNRIGLVRLGQSIVLDLVRDGEAFEIDVTVEAPADGFALLEGVGVAVRRTRDGSPFVVVSAVDAGSAGARAGLREGDILLGVGDRRVRSIGELERLARAHEGELPLVVQRGRERRSVVLE